MFGLSGDCLHLWQLCVSKNCVRSFSNVKKPCSWSSSSLIVAPALVKGKCLVSLQNSYEFRLKFVACCLNLLFPCLKQKSSDTI